MNNRHENSCFSQGPRPNYLRPAFAFLFAAFLPLLLAALPPGRLPAGPAQPAVLPNHPDPASGPSVWKEARDYLPLGSPPAQPALAPDLADRALVLCWHTFLGNPAYDTDFSLAEFAAQLDAIQALGYRFVTVEDFLAGRIEGRRNVIVTIDDGHRTVPAAIAKVLAPRGIVPTLFVYPAVLGTTDFSMSDTTLASLSASGVPVGSHGYHHLFVTDALFKDSPAAFMDEIYKSKAKTEALSGGFVLAYAYPFGALSPRAKVELRKAGFAAAFAVKPGFVYARAGLNDEYELPRLVVTRAAWKDIEALLARNAGDS